MSSQVAHIIRAQQFLSKPRGIDESKFMVGTVFPDIRYQLGLPRELTHRQNVTLEQVALQPSSFQAGLLLHSYVDYEFNTAMRAAGLYPDHDIYVRATALKFMEDEILYPRMYWGRIGEAFDELLPEEMDMVPAGAVRRWHDILQELFKSGPSGRAEVHLMQVLQFDPETIKAIAGEMIFLREDPAARKALDDFDRAISKELEG